MKTGKVEANFWKIETLFHACSHQKRNCWRGCLVVRDCCLFWDSLVDEKCLVVLELAEVQQAVKHLKRAKRGKIKLGNGWWQRFISVQENNANALGTVNT